MKTVLINGSPKKKFSMSSYLLGMVRLLVKGEVVTEKVRNGEDHERVLKNIENADVVVFGVPLYVDGVPSHMLAFMKEMERFCIENQIHLNVYVLSNGGFIEGCQSRPVMQVFENFCIRCNFRWCGGLGIGGGVMLGVMRILFFVFVGLFALNVITARLTTAFPILAEQMIILLVLSLGVIFYGFRMGIAINKREACGVKFTRVLIPSFLFIIGADIFFVIISIIKGGFFRGWVSRK